MQIINTQNNQHKKAIVQLYKEAFATGQSKQYIDFAALEIYIENLLKEDYNYVEVEQEQVIGAILTCPLSSQEYIPQEITANFDVTKCVYIAEVMVAEHARGQGIGWQLLSLCLEYIDKIQYTDAFIRVWDQNTQALHLYENLGFTPYCTIDQTKLRANGTESFIMRKVYLHLVCG